MTVALADGPLGLEAKHVWVPATGPAVVLNDLTVALPRVKVDRISGLHALPDVGDSREPRTASVGETIYPVYPQGKTITYEGRIMGRTLAEMRSLGQTLRSGFGERSSEGIMTLSPQAGYGSGEWHYSARSMAFTMDDEQTLGEETRPTPFQRNFIATVRASDPRFYWSDVLNTGSQAGGATYNMANAGNAQTDPTFTIEVNDGAELVIQNLSQLSAWDNNPLVLRFGASDYAGTVTISFARRTVFIHEADQTVHDMESKLDLYNSTWWDELEPALAPGDNNVQVSGATSWSAFWASASW